MDGTNTMKLGTWGFKAHRDCCTQQKHQWNKHKHKWIRGGERTTVGTIVASNRKHKSLVESETKNQHLGNS